MVDAVIEYWVLWLCGIVGTGIVALVKSAHNNSTKMTKEINAKIDMLAEGDAKKHDELDEKLDKVARGQLETMRYRLRRNTEYLLEKDCATLDELEDLERLFEAYADLGGNSTLKAKYNACLLLPICSEKGRSKVD